MTNEQGPQVSERRQQENSSRNSSRGQNDQCEASVNCSTQARRSMQQDYSMMNYPTNSNLITPMCWSKHASLLGDLVGVDSSNHVKSWPCDKVLDFLSKFGVNKLLLDKFKYEV